MASAVIYLDETGDLGWTLDKPYRHGGSSRYLTIAALVVPSDKTHLPKRLIKDLYRTRKWSRTSEKKWSDMGPESCLEFANMAARMREKEPGITYHTITAKKENVALHIRKDSNKLYNYMIKTVLLNKMATFQFVQLVPDPRSIKVASGNSLHDYLQTQLWFEKNAQTVLQTSPIDSAKCLGLQLTDMLAGCIWSYHEDNESAPWNVLNPHTANQRLFF